MPVYSYRYDTFLNKFLLERKGRVIAQLKQESIVKELVNKLNGEDEPEETPDSDVIADVA